MKNPVDMTQKELDANSAKLARLLKLALDETKSPVFADRMAFQAAEIRGKYLALVDSGFTEGQALFLCKP